MNDATNTPRLRKNFLLYSSGSIVRESPMKMYFAKRPAKDGAGEVQVLVVENEPVFRSGTFSDSMGYEHTWEPLHMDFMAQNFNLLSQRNIFSDVPVRKGHGSFFGEAMDGLVGYITGLDTATLTSSHDGKPYDYILASYEILDEDAAKKIKSGLWRNRSAEVGTYVTNDKAEFSPTFLGFAFVDIPAVEGLNNVQFNNSVNTDEFAHMKESPVTDTPGTGTAPVAPAAVAPVAPASGPTAVPAVPAAFAAATPTVSLYGKAVSDLGAIQSHVSRLEEFESVMKAKVRTDFLNGLVSSNKVLAPQVTAADGTDGPLAKFAKGLSEEQFADWQATYTDTPALPFLGEQASGEFGQGTPPAPKDDTVADAKTIALESLQQFKRGGLTLDEIKKTPSFGRLQQLDPAAAAAFK